MKYEGPNSHQSKGMANVKVFAGQEMDKQIGQNLYAPDLLMLRGHEKFYYDQCPNPVYFDTPLFIINWSAVKTLICHREIWFSRVFAQTRIHDFGNTILNS